MASNKNNKADNNKADNNKADKNKADKNKADTNDMYNMHQTNTSYEEITDDSENGSKSSKKKITIEVDEDDPCLKKEEEPKIKGRTFFVPGLDPRFQQQNQTIRCSVMYMDFYRCEHILGEGAEACTWFKQVFTSFCPNDWIRNWDELRLANKLPWHKEKTQGKFPGDKYGV